MPPKRKRAATTRSKATKAAPQRRRTPKPTATPPQRHSAAAVETPPISKRRADRAKPDRVSRPTPHPDRARRDRRRVVAEPKNKPRVSRAAVATERRGGLPAEKIRRQRPAIDTATPKTPRASRAGKPGGRSGAKPGVAVRSTKQTKLTKPTRPPARPPTKREREIAAERARLARLAARRAAAAEARAIEEARRAKRNERRRERYRIAHLPPDSPELIQIAATGWLEQIRDHCAAHFAVSLDVTYAGGGPADLDGADAQLASRTPWLIVGRFDPIDDIGYQQLARALTDVDEDDFLAAAINPDRLSQIRIVFSDVASGRNEGDSVVSQIGAWGHVISDIVLELVGHDVDHPDEDSLAAKYQASTIPKFYVFFSSNTQTYQDRSPWGKTATVKLK